MSRVFVSYGRADGDFADVLRHRIGDAGFQTWIDLEGVQGGEDWRQEIDDAIRNSVALIVVLTPDTARSQYVNYEWAFALGAGVRVIPVLLQPTDVHPRLATVQQLDFCRRELRPWSQLIDALREAADARPAASVRVPRSAPAIVRDAVAALDSPERSVWEHALLRLAQMALPEANDALVAALAHPLPDLRIGAAWHLARRGDARAMPALIEGNRRLGWHAEFARKVREIGPVAIPALLPLLDDASREMRRDAVWALQEVGDATVVPQLIQRLADEDVEVRGAACDALRGIDTEAARVAIQRALPGWTEDLRSSSVRTRQEARRVLERMDSAAARAALAQVDGPPAT